MELAVGLCDLWSDDRSTLKSSK